MSWFLGHIDYKGGNSLYLLKILSEYGVYETLWGSGIRE